MCLLRIAIDVTNEFTESEEGDGRRPATVDIGTLRGGLCLLPHSGHRAIVGGGGGGSAHDDEGSGGESGSGGDGPGELSWAPYFLYVRDVLPVSAIFFVNSSS